MKNGFTLIEILVVATIIVLLSGIVIGSYSSFLKSARDAKRKADIENIRGALELYRSNNGGSYPQQGVGGDFPTFACPAGAFMDTGGNTYMNPVPNDPKCSSGMSYRYVISAPYVSYDLYAAQESVGAGTSYHATPYGSQ